MRVNPLKIVFAGTPEFAARHLKTLIDSPNHQLIAAYTQPDRPAGRGKKMLPSPVKQLAEQFNIPVLQPASLKSENAGEELKALQADVMVVVAYGLILPQAILDIPRLGCLNVHGSTLPRWRGAAPIQRAIEAGDSATGITIMQMDAGLDTGDILAEVACPIGSTTTAASLHNELAVLGGPLLLQVLDQLAKFQSQARPQPDAGATYAHKIVKSEALINWDEPASSIDKKVRAFNPFPIAFTTLGDERLKIHQAHTVQSTQMAPSGTILEASSQGIHVRCGENALCITQLQLPGSKVITAEQILNAKKERFAPGVLLGN